MTCVGVEGGRETRVEFGLPTENQSSLFFWPTTRWRQAQQKDGGGRAAGGQASEGQAVLTSQNLAPIWLPHWPAWRWTISRMLAVGRRAGVWFFGESVPGRVTETQEQRGVFPKKEEHRWISIFCRFFAAGTAST
jgi:hypothetical protein